MPKCFLPILTYIFTKIPTNFECVLETLAPSRTNTKFVLLWFLAFAFFSFIFVFGKLFRLQSVHLCIFLGLTLVGSGNRWSRCMAKNPKMEILWSPFVFILFSFLYLFFFCFEDECNCKVKLKFAWLIAVSHLVFVIFYVWVVVVGPSIVVVHSVINKTTVATFTYQSNQATVRQARRDRICLYLIYTNYSLVQHNRIGIRYLGIFRKIVPLIHKV